MQGTQNMAPRLKRQNEEEELDSDGNELQRFGSSSLKALLLPLHSLRMGLLTKNQGNVSQGNDKGRLKRVGGQQRGQHDR